MIVNMMPQYGASLTDDSRVVIYNHNMFITQATGFTALGLLTNICRRFLMVEILFSKLSYTGACTKTFYSRNYLFTVVG